MAEAERSCTGVTDDADSMLSVARDVTSVASIVCVAYHCVILFYFIFYLFSFYIYVYISIYYFIYHFIFFFLVIPGWALWGTLSK